MTTTTLPTIARRGNFNPNAQLNRNRNEYTQQELNQFSLWRFELASNGIQTATHWRDRNDGVLKTYVYPNGDREQRVMAPVQNLLNYVREQEDYQPNPGIMMFPSGVMVVSDPNMEHPERCSAVTAAGTRCRGLRCEIPSHMEAPSQEQNVASSADTPPWLASVIDSPIPQDDAMNPIDVSYVPPFDMDPEPIMDIDFVDAQPVEVDTMIDNPNRCQAVTRKGTRCKNINCKMPAHVAQLQS